MADKELYNQSLSDTLSDSDRLSAGVPGQNGAKNILWSKVKEALAAVFVSLTGNQTINGEKTFNVSPKVPDPTEPLGAVNLRTLQAQGGGATADVTVSNPAAESPSGTAATANLALTELTTQSAGLIQTTQALADQIAALGGASMYLDQIPGAIPQAETRIEFNISTGGESTDTDLLDYDETDKFFNLKKAGVRYQLLLFMQVQANAGGDKTLIFRARNQADGTLLREYDPQLINIRDNQTTPVSLSGFFDNIADDLGVYLTYECSNDELTVLFGRATATASGAEGGGEDKPDLVQRPRTGVTEVIDMNLNQTTQINFNNETEIDIQVTPPSDTLTKQTTRRVVLNNVVNPNAVNSITFNDNGGTVFYMFGDGDPINSLAIGAQAVIELSNVGNNLIYVETKPAIIV